MAWRGTFEPGRFCGNVSLPPEWDSRYFYLSPREIVERTQPEVAKRLDARLRGEHVEVFKQQQPR